MSRCTACHRRQHRNGLCIHHHAIARHHERGFPELELDVTRVPHVTMRGKKGGLPTLEPRPMRFTEPPPCTSMDSTLFFIEEGALTKHERHALEQTCLSCPVLTLCRETAIATAAYGFQGGMNPKERQHVRVIRGQAIDSGMPDYIGSVQRARHRD